MGIKIDIASINNIYSWEYDSWINIGTFLLDLETHSLTLRITQVHTKSGLGKGVFTKQLEEVEVGSLLKPNKGLIRSILSKHKQQVPFAKDGWRTDTKKDFTLSEVLDYTITENVTISRYLKLKKIKSKIKYIK